MVCCRKCRPWLVSPLMISLEQKPQCRRCLERGLECSYTLQLLWPDEPSCRANARKNATSWQAQAGRIQSAEDWNANESSRNKLALRKVLASRITRGFMFVNTTSEDVRLQMRPCKLGRHARKSLSAEREDNFSETGSTCVIPKQRSSFLDGLPSDSITAMFLPPIQFDQTASYLFDYCKCSVWN